MTPAPLRLGTRGSQLALYQANTVARLIAEAGGPPCELVIIKTSGDRLQERPLSEVGGKRLFTMQMLWIVDRTLPGWAFATTEAPVHRTCADLALKVCPHLRELGDGPVRWDPPTAVVKAIIGGPATDQDFGLQLNGRKIVGHLKFVWKTLPISMQPVAWT